MLVKELANSSAISSIWQCCQLILVPVLSNFFNCFQLFVGWQPCQTEELAEELANFLAYIGFLD